MYIIYVYEICILYVVFFFFSSRRRHTRCSRDWSSDVCSSDLAQIPNLYVAIDGSGVPVVARETEGRQGKDPTGKAKTREAKLGCVFTQTTVDEEGYAVRDEESTTYVGAIEEAEFFGRRIYAEAVRRGLLRARRVIVLGDGAKWIWGIVEEHFLGALEIDRKSTRLNSSHGYISYAVFCLKKKNTTHLTPLYLINPS